MLAFLQDRLFQMDNYCFPDALYQKLIICYLLLIVCLISIELTVKLKLLVINPAQLLKELLILYT